MNSTTSSHARQSLLVGGGGEGRGGDEDGSQSLGIQETRMLLKTAPERRLTPLRLLLSAIISVLYLAAVLAYCAGLRQMADPSKHRAFLIILRPFPILLLVALVLVYAERNKKTLTYTSFVVVGLLCCFISDILFATSNEESVYGLSFSLLAKTAYTIAFTVGVGKGAPLRLLLSVPFYAFCGAVVALVYAKVQFSLVLFVIDSFVTSTMGWRALALTSGFPGSDRAKLLLWLSVVGAALWMSSDTLRIISAYYHPMAPSRFLTPMLYYLGQLANTFSVPRRLTRSDYWLDHFTFLIESNVCPSLMALFWIGTDFYPDGIARGADKNGTIGKSYSCNSTDPSGSIFERIVIINMY